MYEKECMICCSTAKHPANYTVEHRTEGIPKMLSPWLGTLRQPNWGVRRGAEGFSLSGDTGKALIPFSLGSLLGGRKGCSTA